MSEKLKEIIAAQGLSWEAASLKCDMERSYFRKLFERDGVPSNATFRKISKGLKVPLTELLSDAGIETETFASPQHQNDVRAADATLPAFAQLDKDVPVMGTAAGSHLRGSFQLSTDAVDNVRRPQTLMSARNVYALYVEGSSMEPQYFPGDLVYVHPDKPPRFGDVVIIQCQKGKHEPIEATIGILTKRTAEKITIHKHNPAADIEISRSIVKHTHKVLSLNEIYGV
ncbi:XRE family transcriptional regulator [Rhizobium rhizogenes]|uniref:XRE family transcriptional regulator n=1 Tax=Rhizobium rhizogenes TaxID=359 RepID=UPI0015725151|nr:LexA family transcriptional regulator [Rhizobium rhizogenes]NTI27640.1 LexA family transcriptional regulator [Rhizobium rhizogenes]